MFLFFKQSIEPGGFAPDPSKHLTLLNFNIFETKGLAKIWLYVKFPVKNFGMFHHYP